MNDELQTYIINQIERGFSKQEITNTLLQAGWRQEDITDIWKKISTTTQNSFNSKNIPTPSFLNQ